MHIEHVAWQVEDPHTVADWYVHHLGFTIKRSAHEPVPVVFMADSSNRMLIEIYNNPKAPILDYAQLDPLQLHLAFTSEDISTDTQRLIAAGCKLVQEIGNGSPETDHITMFRDPFGFAIQLCRRADPMV
jgi:hypothetical protein